ncbi:MAG: insulinase family protein [bacterium]|nr:insulinase family protein [bacterium]
MKKGVTIFLMLVLFSFFTYAGFDFGKIKNNISEFTLPNGLKFILLEDHSVPIATFMIYANVGGSDERVGINGISHYLEHMAFKGTSVIGTTNYEAEKKLFKQMDLLWDKIVAEKNSSGPDQEKITGYQKELDGLVEEAAQYVKPNEFVNIMKRHGGSDFNAGTGIDSTMYYFNLPSNKLELWMYMESSRFTDPVFREFYKERGVIREERLMRTENNFIGKLFEEMLALSYKVHPYRTSVIGPMSDIENISRTDMYHYFRTNYTAKNMVVGIAGDIYPDQLKKLATKYFSKLKPGRKNFRIYTKEPKQLGEKSMTIYDDYEPLVAVGYHIPSMLHEDFIKFSILDNIITSGRSSRLQKKLIIDKKSATQVASFAGLPGSKYPTLYLLAAFPTKGHNNDEMLKAIDEEIERLKTTPVTGEELNSAKTREKLFIINGLKSSEGMIGQLLRAEAFRGSWRKTFDNLDAIEKITTEDIQKLVNKYLVKSNRSIVRFKKKKEVKK